MIYTLLLKPSIIMGDFFHNLYEVVVLYECVKVYMLLKRTNFHVMFAIIWYKKIIYLSV